MSPSKITCCMYCSKRTVGCHSTCETYLKQKKASDEARDAINKKNAMERMTHAVMHKYRKRHKGVDPE